MLKKKYIIFLGLVLIVKGEELKFDLIKIDENLIVVNISKLENEFKNQVTIEEYPYHKVKRGDYLSKIAKNHDKKTKNLVKINELENPNLIYPKQKIYLERKKNINLNDIPEYYIVKKGENLISVALEYELNWKDLKRINNLENITDIYPGQKIKLK